MARTRFWNTQTHTDRVNSICPSVISWRGHKKHLTKIFVEWHFVRFVSVSSPLLQHKEKWRNKNNNFLVSVCRVWKARVFGLKVIKLFSCSTEFFLLIKVKMPTIVGILTFMSRQNSILGLSYPEKKVNFLILLYLWAFKISCSAELPKSFITSGLGLFCSKMIENIQKP